ncbi:MAG: 50S ribosomal protein L31 [Candidatus Omnitrophica bacterium]|nr:50S ribosomal protein L31 [Candidatus Omnitrophota bacterium]
MKQDIHPQYQTVTVQCACGSSFETRSAAKDNVIQTDVCSACHPFFTGKQKLMDTAGRIDRLKKKFGNKIAAAPVKKIAPAAVRPAAQASSSKLSIKDKLKQAAQQKPGAEAPKAE